jgi:hypothetical protein
MCYRSESQFVYDVWIIDGDNNRRWYTRCSSLEYAEKRLERFIARTPKNKYRGTLITFSHKDYATWEVGKEWDLHLD